MEADTEPPVPSLRVDRSLSTALMAISSVVCCAGASGCSAEEPVDSPRIILPRRGVFMYHLHRQAFIADTNSAFLLDPGDVCRVSHPIHGGDDCTVLVPSPALLEATFGERRWLVEKSASPHFRVKRIASTPKVQLGLQVLQAGMIEPRETLLAQEAAMALLDEIGQPPAASSFSIALQRSSVERARAFLACFPGEPHSLESIGKSVHSSPFHLARQFRRVTGSSIHQYLTSLRMAAALDRLADGEEDLARLALDLGFANHSHFSACFRRTFGFSPGLARKALARKNLLEMRRILTAGCPASGLPS